MQTIKLNNNIEMPILGYGVFQVSPEECERCVLDAIGMGYRLIDMAQAYYNETGVGNAVAKCGVPRNELFLTTKVWITNAGEERAARSIDESLRKLRTDYIDLLLIHQPFSDYPGTWRAMEKAVKDGKVRAIGLSNFYPDRFVDMAEYTEIKPAVNQLKTNVFSQQWDAEAEMNPYGTRIMAWAPLAQGARTPNRLRADCPGRKIRQDGTAGGITLSNPTQYHRHSENYPHRTYEAKPGGIRFCTRTGGYGKYPYA
jgi:oxidoreductase